ncbi:MAG: tyrosine-type recombinase/integrase [Rubrobacteraceae bacterium]
MADRDGGLVFDAGALTVGAFFDRWLDSSVRDTARPSTHERNESRVELRIKPMIGRVKLGSLTPAHVQGLYRDRLDYGLSPATVHKIHVVLHKALDDAVRWSLIPRNATDAVTAPRPIARDKSALSRAGQEAPRCGAREQVGGPVCRGGHHGHETGRATRSQVGGCRAGGRRRTYRADYHPPPRPDLARRTVQLPGASVKTLEDHLRRQLEEIEHLGDSYRDQGLIFTTEAGTPINPSNLRKRSFEPLLKRAGLHRIRFHDLRHTCATLLLSKNTRPKIVQEMLGHATIAITLDTCSHILPGLGDQAARTMEELLF